MSMLPVVGCLLPLALAACAPRAQPSQPPAPEPAALAFTGFWKGEHVRPDGGRPLWDFSLRVVDGRVTGTVFGGGKPTTILGGTAGEAIVFTDAHRAFGGVRAGAELHLHLSDRLGTIVVHRVSTDPTPPPRPGAPLPAPRAVPPNGLARTPPMGWSSWNRFGTSIDDGLIRQIADALVTSGMRDAGYTFVNIDDGWAAGRDARGRLVPTARFPDMKRLADDLHARGLKLGLYSSPGPRTCAGFAGSLGHEADDAASFAAWGVDYLKYDWCSAARIFEDAQMRLVYQAMGQALADAGRPIVYSLCQYGLAGVEAWGREVGGNLWRTTEDIKDNWASMSDIGFERQAGLAAAAGPGHFNDPDMLEVGNGGMSDDEYRTHMSLWAMLAAPLIAGNDLRTMSAATAAILTNVEVIAVDQDALGTPGRPVLRREGREVWTRPLTGGALAVALFNRGAAAAEVAASWAELGVEGRREVRDLWAHAARGSDGREVRALVPAHGVVLLRLSPGDR